MFSGMPAGFLKVAAVALVTGGVAVALLTAACGGGEDSSPIVQAATTLTVTITPQSTALPTATPQPPMPTDPPAPTATPKSVVPTATPQPPAPAATFTSKPTCPPRTNNHVDIDILRLQPGMIDAVITELDSNSVRIMLEGFRFTVRGRADHIGLGVQRDAPEALISQVWQAIGPAAYEC